MGLITRAARRGFNEGLLRLRPRVARELDFMARHQWDSPEAIDHIQQERLARLLDHAYRHVPYYRELFDRCGVVRGGRVSPEQLGEIPVLTKKTFRERSDELRSDDLDRRKWHENRTSGSTGEPMALVQDREDVEISGGAVLKWFYRWHGIQPGDSELKLWGSEKDLLTARSSRLHELRHLVMGIEILNAFRMTPERMGGYIERINEVRPRLLRGYSSNLLELARYAEENRLEIRPPRLVISSAGTLYPEMRARMEAAFGCPVVNHYGSRDMHNMGMECALKRGLHMASFTHVIEILDDSGELCEPGVEGNIVVTSLTNRAQPLIRYAIGDRGLQSDEICACGRGMRMLDQVTGRRVDCFRTREGKVIPGEYFIYILGVFLEDTPFATVQAIQTEFDRVEVNVVLKPGGELPDTMRDEIVEKTKLVMGDGCEVEVNEVDEIPPLASGKFPYTVCRLPGAAEFEVE